ncbi:MAG: hypothetical protein ACOCV7_03580 [Desulfonatronovibrionaceae bacterium]
METVFFGIFKQGQEQTPGAAFYFPGGAAGIEFRSGRDNPGARTDVRYMAYVNEGLGHGRGSQHTGLMVVYNAGRCLRCGLDAGTFPSLASEPVRVDVPRKKV